MSSRSDRARRHALGQHYLNDPAVADRIIGLAKVRPGEHVLEIGTGRGALTKKLVRLTDYVEGYEIDKDNYEQLEQEIGGSAKLNNRDAFDSSPDFDVLVSTLPYSESSRFVEWLSQRFYNRAIVVVQRDFAKKITAAPGSEAYRAVSVISQVSAEVKIVGDVYRDSFDPPPRVNSCIVTMRWHRTLTPEQTAMIKRIFSQKRKTVKAALNSLGLEAPPSAPAPGQNDLLQCRVGSLRPESVLAMTGVLERSKSE